MPPHLNFRFLEKGTSEEQLTDTDRYRYTDKSRNSEVTRRLIHE